MKPLRKSGFRHFFDSLKRDGPDGPSRQRVEKPRLNRIACAGAGEREGAAARLAWDRMPRNALPRKACGQRSEDFCAAVRRESNGILEGCRKSPRTFSTA